jgi:hypothetical protein
VLGSAYVCLCTGYYKVDSGLKRQTRVKQQNTSIKTKVMDVVFRKEQSRHTQHSSKCRTVNSVIFALLARILILNLYRLALIEVPYRV